MTEEKPRKSKEYSDISVLRKHLWQDTTIVEQYKVKIKHLRCSDILYYRSNFNHRHFGLQCDRK